MSDHATKRAEHVELCIPAQADLMVLARFTTATVASRLGFSIDEIEDLRLAVDEICLSLLGETPSGRLRLHISSDAESLEITGVHEDEGNVATTPWEPHDELSSRILAALVDEHGHGHIEGRRCAWLRKKLTST